jgi:hypothetical protein
MEIPGNSVSVVEDTQDADPFMKAGVLDGDAGCDRQCLSERLVLLAELVSAHFVGEIQVAINRGAGSDGDAEEGHSKGLAGRDRSRNCASVDLDWPRRAARGLLDCGGHPLQVRWETGAGLARHRGL